MKKGKVYIVHGYMAAATDHWFPWLNEQLAKEGIEVTILSLPDSVQPDREKWLDYMVSHVQLDENTIFVAHSLGCLATFNLLEYEKRPIKGLLLVSGFINQSPLTELDAFVSSTTDTQLIKGLASNRISIAAKDDTIVPYQMTVELSKKLDAELLTLEEGNHLMASDGFIVFPLLLEILRKWF
jgi:uncharacterized protein